MSSSQRAERGAREGSHDGPEALPTAAAAAVPPGMAGFWAIDGREFSRQGLNDNLRSAEWLMQGWRDSLQMQRAALDVFRDRMRQQQDMMLAASMALLGAALGLENAHHGRQAASELERAASNYGRVWRHALDAGMACCWAGSIPPAANAQEPPSGPMG